jgi:hypothetical protein
MQKKKKIRRETKRTNSTRELKKRTLYRSEWAKELSRVFEDYIHPEKLIESYARSRMKLTARELIYRKKQTRHYMCSTQFKRVYAMRSVRMAY